MGVRRDPRLGGDQFEQQRVDLDAIERRQAEAGQGGKGCEDRGDEIAEAWLAGQVRPPRGHVHAGQHDLADAFMARNRRKDVRHRKRQAAAPALRDDAEGAGMIAAVLYRNEGPGVLLALQLRRATASPCLRLQLVGVGDNRVDLCHAGKGILLDRGCAPGNHKPRFRIFSPQPTYRAA